MSTCADALADSLREAGIRRMFGLPGGEVLDFMEAARRAGIEFLLTRNESAASFMADVTGQIERRPGVCVATLGPGAVNMTLGVANAYLDRSPLIAITATLARGSAPVATHQALDLNAVYRPFTKLAITLDGVDTAAKVRHAIAVSRAPRMGPVHIALPGDLARAPERFGSGLVEWPAPPGAPGPPSPASLDRLADEIARARRPVLILGLDIDPTRDVPAVRRFVDAMGVPVFVTPKAKGILSEDHALYCGVCAGVSGDAVVLDELARADLLVGIGYDPVESDKIWHSTLPLVSVGPVSIAVGDYRPRLEAVGDLPTSLADLERRGLGPFDWPPDECASFRDWLHARAPSVDTTRWPVRLRGDAPAAGALPTRDRDGHRRRVGEADYDAGMGGLRAAHVLRIERAVGHGLRATRRHGGAAPVSRPAGRVHGWRWRVRHDDGRD